MNECPLTFSDGDIGCGLQLAAETKLEILKANDNVSVVVHS